MIRQRGLLKWLNPPHHPHRPKTPYATTLCSWHFDIDICRGIKPPEDKTVRSVLAKFATNLNKMAPKSPVIDSTSKVKIWFIWGVGLRVFFRETIDSYLFLWKTLIKYYTNTNVIYIDSCLKLLNIVPNQILNSQPDKKKKIRPCKMFWNMEKI